MSRLLYLQSGGPTAVLNLSAQGVIDSARALGVSVCAAADGLAGLLGGRLLDCDALSADDCARLGQLPGAAFGSSRDILPPYDEAPQLWQQLAEVLQRHDIRQLLLNGGNGSMETALLLQQLAERFQLPLTVVGIPKTIDNDLEATDFSPGFPSAAKYLASSLREVLFDMRSMAQGRVFILETMGRHVGWLAAAGCLAALPDEAPPLLLLPEVAYDEARLFAAVQAQVAVQGYCAIVVSEGLRGADGRFVAQRHADKVYGHEQLGGAGNWLAQRIQQQLQLHAHVAVADCLQRAARHLLSAVDARLAYEVGRKAVQWALAGQGGVMAAIERFATADGCDWQVVPQPLAAVANLERALPADFIAASGLDVTPACRAWLQPLLAGEVALPFADGLPDMRRLHFPPLASSP
ncbi:diphosphate--fructose-6-phosphate 1-phosphotransferase [Vogesella sp. LIG4]|uniref:diphosphate--fructose-6-phosphate 1-phosphotransferase n=1 Tax=Vogesella sp. LIG4 TaxID=1192162 RepID=UPI00081FE96C|nr:diphosphate--fructose-6-phosphate 1-phosphotransferase [Vogesella sp. LIG4]SCK06487.1 6-phosphofructokinase 1 [Vogesella sp. LIG4]